jgi:hypothetical protein
MKGELDREGYYYIISFFNHKKADYKKLISQIDKELKKYNDPRLSKLDYLVYLTKSGTFGSYKLPNKIYVNINRPANKITKTIIHEAVHLLVEEDVQQKRLNSKQKEKLVDSIVRELEIKPRDDIHPNPNKK